MIRDQSSIEYEIAQRQIVMRDMPQKSMFIHIQCLFDLYGLPSVFELMCNTPPKLVWKNALNRKIHEMVELYWKSDITNKSFTKYINADVLKVGALHHAWSTVRNNVHDSKRAQNKVYVTYWILHEPRSEKTGLRGFRPGPTKTGLHNHMI